MSTEITWLGHNAWSIRAGEHRLRLDPFHNDNPLSPCKADKVAADLTRVSQRSAHPTPASAAAGFRRR